ncbi:MAG TPA: LysR family transcriptional regulator [Rhabdaerophilum sp.]|nr:LysR family transcriptional regulator [Rhabdaerophilum sp.]
MPLDDHRLRYLHETIRHGSLRGAADNLGVNPSVVSRQIAQLEKELGMLLLERLGRGVRATEAGELLSRRYRQWTADREDTIAELREIQDLHRGHVSVILGEGFISDLMSGSLRRYWERYPRLTMSLEFGGSIDIVHAVANDLCHIGLAYNIKPDPRVRIWRAMRHPVEVIVRPDHPLVRLRGKITLADVSAYPVALLYANSGVRQRVTIAEAAENIELTPRLTATSISILRHFVMANMGVTLLPAFSVAPDIVDGSLVALPVENALLQSTEAQIVTRIGRRLPEAASQLLRFLTAQMAAFSARPEGPALPPL